MFIVTALSLTTLFILTIIVINIEATNNKAGGLYTVPEPVDNFEIETDYQIKDIPEVEGVFETYKVSPVDDKVQA